MHAIIERLRASPFFAPAIAAPILIAFIFSFFSLTAAPDPERIAHSVTLGIVNLDAGAPGLPIKIGEQLVAGLSANAPFGTATFADEAAGRAALEAGDVTALLVLPETFTGSVAAKGPVPVKIVTTQHLSAAQTQLGGVLPTQLQFAINTALGQVAQRMGGAAGPVVAAETEVLHASPGAAASLAPAIVTSALWLAGLVGGLMVLLASRGAADAQTAPAFATVRSIQPLVVTLASSLVLSLVVAGTTALWGSFLALWIMLWVLAYAIAILALGLFAVLDLWALVVILPLVFYQAALNGAQLPIAAGPDWLHWLSESLPFTAPVMAVRSLLIGGPDGGWLGSAILAAVTGLVLVWAGTFLWARMRPSSTPAHVHV